MTGSTTVCLTVDIDAYSAVLFGGVSNAALLSRGEFSIQTATPRILDVLRRQGVPGTFFVPGHTAHVAPGLIEKVRSAGHEVGGHGYLHEPPAQLEREQERDALLKSIDTLRKVTGEHPHGYRAPLWEPSVHTIALLQEQGFQYDSSLMGTDFVPYIARIDDSVTEDGVVFGPPSSIVELPSSWVFDDWAYFANTRRAGGGGPVPPSHVWEIWTETLEYHLASEDRTVLVMTMHPEVSAQGYVLRLLERFIVWGRERGARFATMADAAAEWRSASGAGNAP